MKKRSRIHICSSVITFCYPVIAALLVGRGMPGPDTRPDVGAGERRGGGDQQRHPESRGAGWLSVVAGFAVEELEQEALEFFLALFQSAEGGGVVGQCDGVFGLLVDDPLSAPATMPPTSDISFAAGKAPVPSFEAGSRTCSSTSAGSPHRSASRTTGASPPYPTRFGSSNRAETLAAAWEDCISEVPC
ncbi:hypothetical protein [Streptomyces sp. NPDC058394]|uniref:hypothetical protein n=1 Tax=Streptomyces sp. NPDC058394 TaxID=3346477 RepID=UPI003660721D